jgi:hypothetical protein
MAQVGELRDSVHRVDADAGAPATSSTRMPSSPIVMVLLQTQVCWTRSSATTGTWR